MLHAEWKHLFSRKTLLLSLSVIMFIPIMYGGFFLGSIWDPYGKTSDLPVAFVNEDTGAILSGEHVTIGNDVVNTLKDNADIGWEFVNKATADAGIKSGYYYASVVIPENFSENAASITSSQPQKAVISYTVTPAKNYIGSLVTTQAATKVQSSISEKIVKAYAKGIFENIDSLSAGLDEAATGASEISGGSQTLRSGIYSYTQGVSRIVASQQSLTNGISQLQIGATQLQNGLTQADASLPTAGQIETLLNGVHQLQSGISQLNEAVQHPSSELTAQQAEVQARSGALQTALQSLAVSARSVTLILNNANTEIASSGSASLQASDVLELAQFANDSSTVSTNAVMLLTSLQTLNTLLTTQQSTLQQGTASLNTGALRLVPSLEASLSGYNTLRNANSQLLTGSTLLTRGLTTTYDGSQRLSNGAKLLQTNSFNLNNGVAQLHAGSTTLASGLVKAANQIKLQPTSELTQDQLASPVTSTEIKEGDVPNYGYALAPYVLSLGLFVGALVYNVIYPIRKTFAQQNNAISWWIAKASITGVAAFIQASILMVIMVLFLGLHPDHPWQFAGAIYLTSLTYMSIVSLLVIILDNVGRFLAMVLLVLQLGGSEGTFPIQTAPAFFQAINPFLPMTYSIHALREAISGGISTNVYVMSMAIMMAFLVFANLALFGFFIHRGRRTFTHTSVDGDS